MAPVENPDSETPSSAARDADQPGSNTVLTEPTSATERLPSRALTFFLGGLFVLAVLAATYAAISSEALTAGRNIHYDIGDDKAD